MSEVTLSAGSPFDALKRHDERGEFWLARELMKPLGYTQWRSFADAIERARISLGINGQSADVHIVQLREPATGRGSSATQSNCRLTREGAYAVVQNCDIRKAEVAQAHHYFRVRTMQAEEIIPDYAGVEGIIGDAVPLKNPALRQIVGLAFQMQAVEDEQLRLAGVQEDHAVKIQDLTSEVANLKEIVPLMADGDGHSVKDLARACSVRFMEMHAWLRDQHVTYRDQQQGGIRVYAHPWIERGWAFERREQRPNGSGVDWVSYFTDDGLAEIKRMLRARS